jgi:hypothetical protein
LLGRQAGKEPVIFGAEPTLAIFLEPLWDAATDEAVKPTTARARTKPRTRVFFIMGKSPWISFFQYRKSFCWTTQLHSPYDEMRRKSITMKYIA